MVEVEMKFAGADFVALERWLSRQDVSFHRVELEEDQYFRPPDRDYAITDEALRLRRVGETNVLTYKGPKRDAATKTRTEIEVMLAPGDSAAAACGLLLKELRYEPVASVRKTRKTYELNQEGFSLGVCLDEVDGLGRFAELEIVAPEEKVEAARRVLERVAAEMGLGQSERRAYLQLLLEKREQRSQ